MIGRIILVISRRIDQGCRWGAVAFLTAMVALVLFQVAARYVFRAVPVWTEEIARYCMVWGGLLGATVAFRSGRGLCDLATSTEKKRPWRTSIEQLHPSAQSETMGFWQAEVHPQPPAPGDGLSRAVSDSPRISGCPNQPEVV